MIAGVLGAIFRMDQTGYRLYVTKMLQHRQMVLIVFREIPDN